MKIALPLASLALVLGTSAGAQQTTTTNTSTTNATTTTKPMIGATKATVNKKTATTAAADANGHMAVHTTSTGKKITYDCSKAGNKNRAACKAK